MSWQSMGLIPLLVSGKVLLYGRGGWFCCALGILFACSGSWAGCVAVF